MAGRPVSANADGDAFGSARHWPARAKPADRLVKHSGPDAHRAKAPARTSAPGFRKGPSPGHQPRKVTRTDPPG
jgi:hypothetical protein